MRNSEYCQKMLQYIYGEGDVDIIFFGQIIGVVSYDENDFPFGKTPSKRFDDGIALVNYLVSIGDFFLGENRKIDGDGVIGEICSGGFQRFFEVANSFFLRGGIDDVDLNSGIWLKKAQVGKLPPQVPLEIDALFSPCGNREN
jgi:hypothetical protein